MKVSSEQLAAWLAGRAEPDVAAAIEQRLPDDADLQARVEALRVADRALADWDDPEATPDAIERIVVRALDDARDVLDAQPASTADAATPTPGRSWGWLGRLAAAGAAVVAVVVGATMLWSGGDDAGPSPAVLSGADSAGEDEAAASMAAPTAEQDAGPADEPEAGDDAAVGDDDTVMDSQERAVADEPVLAWLARVAPTARTADGAVVATQEAPPAALVPGTELALPDRAAASLSRPSPGPSPQGMPPVDGQVPEGGAEPDAAAMDLVHACLAKHGATVPDVGRVILAPHPDPDRDDQVVVVVADGVRVLDTTSCGDPGS